NRRGEMGAVADPCWRVSSAVSGSSRCARAARSSASSLGFKTVMAGPLERCRLNEQFACHRLIRHATLTSIAQHEKCTQWLPVHNWHFLRELSTELSTGRTACRTNTDNPSRRLPLTHAGTRSDSAACAVAGGECAEGPLQYRQEEHRRSKARC